MALFWDGNPSTQSFIKIVGLSAASQLPPGSRTRASSRPASAPAREAHIAHTAYAYRSLPRRGRTITHRGAHTAANDNFSRANTAVGRGFDSCERSGVNGSNERSCVSYHDAGDRYYHRDELEMGGTRALGHRLRQVQQENARLRDAMMDKRNGWGLKRGVDDAHWQNLELIAALLSAKREGGEKKSRRSQDNARILQVPPLMAMLYPTATHSVPVI